MLLGTASALPAEENILARQLLCGALRAAVGSRELTVGTSLGQVAQAEDVPLHVLQNTGPYSEAVDLSISPLAAGQSQPFRLTFEHVTADWNHEYPEMRVTDVVIKDVVTK